MLHRLRQFKSGDVLCWRNKRTLELIDNFTWFFPHGYKSFMIINPVIVIANNKLRCGDDELILLGVGLQKLRYYMLLSDYDISPHINGDRVGLYWLR